MYFEIGNLFRIEDLKIQLEEKNQLILKLTSENKSLNKV